MDLAIQKVRSLLRQAPEPVRFARVKLTMAADPAAARPAIAQANLDLNRRLIRAQATAAMREARPRHTRGRYLVRRLRPSRVARAAAAVRAILELTRRRPGKDR